MEKQVLEAIERFSLLENTKRVTVALSGGADSMSLLYALLSLRESLGIEVRAAHLNHLIRGDEALRDEEFVKEQCKKADVKLYIKREDVPEYARAHKMSLELAARTLRYEFLKSVADGGVIATAHTASDNLETVIFNLARGSALKGICGIPPKRDIFIRPLILATRQDVENYCAQREIPFVTDSTNLEDEYSRNKIRHKIVPVLKELNPSVETAVLRTSELLREDSCVLESLAKDFLNENVDSKSLSLEGFSNLEIAVAKRVVKRFLENDFPQIGITSFHLEGILKIAESGGKTSLPQNMSAVAENGKLYIKPNNKVQNKNYKVQICEKFNDSSQNPLNVNSLLLNNSFDCDKIVGELVVRTREIGDSIRLVGRGCTKSLRKLYNEEKIPNEERDILPLIADENGVVWIHKIGIASRVAVKKTTKRIFTVNVAEEFENE